MPLSVRVSAVAASDLREIGRWIADRADEEVAEAYVGRIVAAFDRLLPFPGKGTPRDKLKAGLRSMSFERRTTIYYEVADNEVVIVRVFRDARDAKRVFSVSDS